ncbi:5830_t:CDS:2, partial [Gigaspora rosea]
CMKTINQRFERLEQMNIQSDDISGNQNNDSGQTTAESNQQDTIETNRELNTPQGESGGGKRKRDKDIQNNRQKIPTINYEAVIVGYELDRRTKDD